MEGRAYLEARAVTIVERNIRGMRSRFGPQERRFRAGLNRAQQAAWAAISIGDPADIVGILWGTDGLQEAAVGLPALGEGNTVEDCLRACVRRLWQLSAYYWRAVAQWVPYEESERCRQAIDADGVIPMGPYGTAPQGEDALRDDTEVLLEMWVADSREADCPPFEEWCQLVVIKHVLHVVWAILDALR